MALIPTGTVTFLFTDIEGSTQLARKFPEAWTEGRARHHTILKTAITTHDGYIFRTIGDEFNAAFSTALDAVTAAVNAQCALQAEDWGVLGSIRVRMGLHTGPALPRADEYEGYLTLSHVKRLMSTASGGQMLVSEATEVLLRSLLPQEISLRNLGEFRLKDFESAEHIYQIVDPDLPAEFPPLKSVDSTQNNLPVQLTSFIGRSKEIGEIKELLSRERLLTLTGLGGSGKTRLALQCAAETLEQFRDGVYFIALASVTDPGLVTSAIAQALYLPETPRRSIVESLKDFLQNKTMLLLLDNFEQVISAAPLVAELLMAGSKIKIIATSREGLHISGEHEYPVPALEVPDLSQLPSPDSLTQYASVELFVKRAMAVKPDFRITDDTAPAVVEICHRLDGLPLAIELAAARIKLLPPRAMLAHLEHRLEFLTGGARELPARQQTLRNAIAWSFDLLNESEKKLFQRLSVFVGGCTISAAEAVAEDNPENGLILDRLGALLDKSLLKEVDETTGEPRFVMLETLREFGLEQLEASGEQDTIWRRHAVFFLAIAEQAEAQLGTAGQVHWINLMEQEHGNLRAALDWSREAESASDICLRLAGALGLFWESRGYFSEGRERLSAILLTGPAQGKTASRAKVLARAAELSYRQSDYEATTSFARESLEIYRKLGDKQGIASALIKLGNAAAEMGDYSAASGFLEEALMTWRELADEHGTARALISLGWVSMRSGDLSLAETRLAEALNISRGLGDTRSIGFELSGLGEIAMRHGDFGHATQLVEESLELRCQLGNKWGIGVSLGILGWIAMHQGDWAQAITRLGESMEVRREIGDQSGAAWCLERAAEVALAQGDMEKAVRLFAAGAAQRESIHSVIDPVDRSGYDNEMASLKVGLGEDQFVQKWDEGHALTLEQAVDYALES